MESGSIFVCFLCEKEFRDVDLLQQHMDKHESLPGKHSNIHILIFSRLTDL